MFALADAERGQHGRGPDRWAWQPIGGGSWSAADGSDRPSTTSGRANAAANLPRRCQQDAAIWLRL